MVIKRTTTQARQGQRMGVVHKVLFTSLALVVVAFAAVYFSFF